MVENNISTIEAEKQSYKLLEEGKTVIYFSDDKEIIGIIAVADTIKDKSYEAIEMLKKEKIEVVMLTGDNKIVANGEMIEMDTTAMIINNRTYLPLRFVSEALGFNVFWE